MKYISMFSGIEAATVAWHPLGFEAVAVSELDKFPSAVLKHRWPDVPNLGDMTKVDWKQYRGAVDLVVGGPPCQAFSVAGLRGSLNDARGNLSLAYVRAILDIRPQWCLTENVPGWLNTPDNAFGCFLAGLVGADDPLVSRAEGGAWPSSGIAVGPEYSAAWTVLDAQFFRVPQRRRRVFVVGHLGNWKNCASVLFEPGGMLGNTPPSRGKGENIAGSIGSCSETGGRRTTDLDGHGAHVVYENHGQDSRVKECDVSPQINAKAGTGGGNLPLAITPAPVIFKPSHFTRGKDGAPSEVSPPLSADADKGDQDPIVFESRFVRNGRGAPDTVCPPLKAQSGETGKGDAAPIVAFTQNSRSEVREISGDGQIAADPGAQQQNYVATFQQSSMEGKGTIGYDQDASISKPVKTQGDGQMLQINSAVRRLTPRECERLQGFPDDYTSIQRNGKDTPDGPRYKALGNSMAVPVMRWIGERIQAVEDTLR